MPGLSKLQKGKIRDSLKIYLAQLEPVAFAELHQYVSASNNEISSTFSQGPNFLFFNQYIIYLKAIYSILRIEASSEQKHNTANTERDEITELVIQTITEEINEKKKEIEKEKSSQQLQSHDKITPLHRALIDFVDNTSIEDSKRDLIYCYLITYFDKIPLTSKPEHTTEAILTNQQSVYFRDLVKIFYQLMSEVVPLGALPEGELQAALTILLPKDQSTQSTIKIITLSHVSLWKPDQTKEIASYLAKQPSKGLIEEGYIANLGNIETMKQLESCVISLNNFIRENRKAEQPVTVNNDEAQSNDALFAEISRYDLSKAVAILSTLKAAPQSVLNFIAKQSSWLLPIIADYDNTQRKYLFNALTSSEIIRALSDSSPNPQGVKKQLYEKKTTIAKIIKKAEIDKNINNWSLNRNSAQTNLQQPNLFTKLLYLYESSKLLSASQNTFLTALPEERTESASPQQPDHASAAILSQLPLLKFDALMKVKAALKAKRFHGLLWFFEPSGIRKIRRLLDKLSDIEKQNPEEAKAAKIKNADLIFAIYTEVLNILKREDASYFKIFKSKAVNSFYKENHISLQEPFKAINHLKSAYEMGLFFKVHQDSNAALVCFGEVTKNDPNYLLALYEKNNILLKKKCYTEVDACAKKDFEETIQILSGKKKHLYAANLCYQLGKTLSGADAFTLALQYFKLGLDEAKAACNEEMIALCNASIRKITDIGVTDRTKHSTSANTNNHLSAEISSPPIGIYQLNNFFKEMHIIATTAKEKAAKVRDAESVQAAELSHRARLRY